MKYVIELPEYIKHEVDIEEDVDKAEDFIKWYSATLTCAIKDSTPLTELLDKTYNDFLNSGGDSYCIIDGETYRSDMGYAVEGMRMFIEVLKKRLENKE